VVLCPERPTREQWLYSTQASVPSHRVNMPSRDNQENIDPSTSSALSAIQLPVTVYMLDVHTGSPAGFGTWVQCSKVNFLLLDWHYGMLSQGESAFLRAF
jgi:hypothetical protein